MDLLVDLERLRNFAADVLRTAGATSAQVETVADALVWCDSVGRATQGVWRLPILVERLRRGVIRCPCSPRLEQRGPSVKVLDGDGGFGQYVAHIGMMEAIELARETGVGVVGVRDSNYFGAGAYYVQLAAERGLIGLATSNSFPKVAAHGGHRPALGTNPLAFGAPGPGGRSLLLDMATSTSSGSSVRKASERGEALPEGVAVDREGRALTDPDAARSGALLPLAGPKGFGLALMVEVLSAVLTGAGISHQVRSLYSSFEGSGENGHLLAAIDVSRFMPVDQFVSRMSELFGFVYRSGNGSILLPGEARWRALERSREQGVLIDARTAEALMELARDLEMDTQATQLLRAASSQ